MMLRKVIGAVLIVAGALVFGFLVASGMFFPHLLGPALMIAAGILLLALKRKEKTHE